MVHSVNFLASRFLKLSILIELLIMFINLIMVFLIHNFCRCRIILIDSFDKETLIYSVCIEFLFARGLTKLTSLLLVIAVLVAGLVGLVVGLV